MTSPSVLYVDDEAANLVVFAAGLKGSELSVLTAPGGAAALEVMRKHEVAVLVTERGLGGREADAAVASNDDGNLVLESLAGHFFAHPSYCASSRRTLSMRSPVNEPM